MAAATDTRAAVGAALALAALVSAPARADDKPRAEDARIIGADPGWRIEDIELRTSYLAQDGRGYQSQDGPAGGPGSEHAWILEPWALITIRQSARVVHQVTVPVDVVTAASPNAVDAVSTASLRNVAGAIDVRTAIRGSARDTFTTRVTAHVEEPLSSGTLGAGWRRGLADDNATLAVDATLTVDGFDRRTQYGRYLGKGVRETASGNVALAQLLSPTTVVDARYALTLQHGTLAQTWNAVPVANAGPDIERLPRERLRHAVAARLSQHVPWTRSTVKAWYRYYRDDFGIHAHTVDTAAYQYLARWLVARGSYRFHRQTGADFYTVELPRSLGAAATPRTADSDLAPFDAHEVSLELAVVRGRAPRGLAAWSLGAEVLRYWRSNDFRLTAVSLAIGRQL